MRGLRIQARLLARSTLGPRSSSPRARPSRVPACSDCSILSRMRSNDGTSDAGAIALIEPSASFMRSCSFVCSSCDRSRVRSVSRCRRSRAFGSTASLAPRRAPHRVVVEHLQVAHLGLGRDQRHGERLRGFLVRGGGASSPASPRRSPSRSAWRAEPRSPSTWSIARPSFISDLVLVADHGRGLLDQHCVLPLPLLDRLLDLDLGVGGVLELSPEQRHHVLPRPTDQPEHRLPPSVSKARNAVRLSHLRHPARHGAHPTAS